MLDQDDDARRMFGAGSDDYRGAGQAFEMRPLAQRKCHCDRRGDLDRGRRGARAGVDLYIRHFGDADPLPGLIKFDDD
jgi:hypothetical protein